MARKARKGCTRVRKTIRTKSGTKTFMARPGGSKECGKLPKRKPTAEQKAVRNAFKHAAGACGQKKRSERNRCVKSGMRTILG